MRYAVQNKTKQTRFKIQAHPALVYYASHMFTTTRRPEGEVIVTQFSFQNLRDASQQLEDDSLSNTGCWLGAQFLAGLLGRAVGNVIRKTRLYPEGPLLPRFLDNVTQPFDRNLREAASGNFPVRHPRS